ncbi:MAG: cytidine deaminase [Burkholderiales bacterium]|nr:cytidine deaminase [Burkholderiales bacterium]
MTDPADAELIAAARAVLRERGAPGVHFIGAALRTRSGRVFAAVNLGTNVGRASVCAEAIALGMAAAAGDTAVERVVAVDASGAVVSPCGICREMLSDYAPDAGVIVPGADGPEVAPLGALLPNKFVRGRG